MVAKASKLPCGLYENKLPTFLFVFSMIKQIRIRKEKDAKQNETSEIFVLPIGLVDVPWAIRSHED